MINDAVIDRKGQVTTIFINTRQGKEEVLIDQDDVMIVEELNRLVLYKDPKGRKLARADKSDDQVLLHRHLFDIPTGSRLEWINENTLDLRRENLQLVHKDGTIEPLKEPETVEEPKKKDSKVRGVYFHKASERWHASAFHDKKRYSLGYFKTEQEAADEIHEFRMRGPESPLLKRNRKGI